MSELAAASAPASSANLGPGFDVMALALELRCRVEARPAAIWSVEHVGPEHPPPDCEDAVLAAARAAVGGATALALTVDNRVPLGRGLGSSAAAAAAGSAAAWAASGEAPYPAEVFRLVTAQEGHPDNAAAAVYGGLVAVGPGMTVARLQLHPSLIPVVAVPGHSLATAEARFALPDVVDRQVAARSVARALLLVEGLRRGDAALLAEAAGDELHEAPRRRLHPEADALMEAARGAGAVHACWSGAGPSVLAFAEQNRVGQVSAALGGVLGSEGRVIIPGAAVDGLVWSG